MWRAMQCLLILSAASVLMACSSLQVRAPEFSLPPLPPEVLAPCAEPEPLPVREMTMAELYLTLLRDQAPWAECRRRLQQAAAMIRYQEQVRAEYQRTLSQSSRPWYQFW